MRVTDIPVMLGSNLALNRLSSYSSHQFVRVIMLFDCFNALYQLLSLYSVKGDIVGRL